MSIILQVALSLPPPRHRVLPGGDVSRQLWKDHDFAPLPLLAP